MHTSSVTVYILGILGERRLQRVIRRLPPQVDEAVVYARLSFPQLTSPSCRFVIFAQGRSGSTLLIDLLGSNPDVSCDSEILNVHRRHPAAYALALSQGRGSVYGFKVKPYHLSDAQGIDPSGFLRELDANGWKVIHLSRRNVVSQALSTMVANGTGVWHQLSGSSNATRRSVRINPTELLDQIQGRADCLVTEDAAVADIPHLSVVYEDDLLHSNCHQATADRIFGFLGVTSAQIATRHQRLSDGVVPSVVENREEIYAALTETQWASMLDAKA